MLTTELLPLGDAGLEAPAAPAFAPPLDAWNAAAEPIPTGLDDWALLVTTVRRAVLAPSSHNTQPWRFRLRLVPSSGRGPVLELHADRTRALRVVDPDDRALVVSCGAALAFARATLRAAGRDAEVARFPDDGEPDLLATLRAGAPIAPDADDLARDAAVARRHTNRRPFAARAVPDAVLDRLRATVAAEGAWLRVVTAPAEKDAVAELVAAGDRRQAADPAFRRELAAWMHPDRAHTRDGMPTSAFGVPDVLARPFPWMIRTFDWGDGQAARDRQLARGSPALLVLGTRTDAPAEWLRAGEALGTMLLDATAAGLATSYLNQAIEVPALRPVLARALGVAGAPQLVLRLGYGPEVPPTPRRAIADVLDER